MTNQDACATAIRCGLTASSTSFWTDARANDRTGEEQFNALRLERNAGLDAADKARRAPALTARRIQLEEKLAEAKADGKDRLIRRIEKRLARLG